MYVFKLTRGETLEIEFYPIELSSGNWGATAQVRTKSGILIDDLDVALTIPDMDNPGWYKATVTKNAIDTLTWPITVLLSEIRFTNGVSVITSDPFEIQIFREISSA